MSWITQQGNPVMKGDRTVGWLDEDGSWFLIDETAAVEVTRVDGRNVWLHLRRR